TGVSALINGGAIEQEELEDWLGLSELNWPAYPPVPGVIDLTMGKQKLSRHQDFPEQPPAGWGAWDLPPLEAVRGSFHFHSREVTVPDGGNGEEMSYLQYWGTHATKKVWVLLNRRLTEDLEVPFLKVATKASTLDYQNEGTWYEGAINEATKVTLGDPEVVKLTVRAGENVSETGVVLDPLEANEGTFENERRYDVDLLPVEVVELSPKLKDEAGNEITGSEKPLLLPKRNGMIEEDPYNNRIAHRELKLKIGEPLEGKKVAWTMTPFGVVDGDDVRGDWSESQNHKDRFEASANFGANGFNRLSQESGETTIADDGFTAVRVNLPPIGLNQAVVKVEIEGIEGEIEVVKFEVPAVIVIDPGHGSGTGIIDGSNAIGGEADDSKVVEYSFALDVAQKMEAEVRKNELYKNRNVRVFLTRNADPNIGMGDRTEVARENGCDTYVSIHFNDSVNRQHRDPFYLVDSTGNLNSEDDKALGLRLRQQVETAIAAHETAEGKNSARSQYGPAHWETNLAKGLDTLSDYASAIRLGNGNVVGHTPCRAALIEIEWMSHAAADALFNTEAPANEMGKKEAVRSAVAKALSDACIEDIKEYTDE
ncbi:N-acetylmuramoyl-L-alanine amidase, partial [Haloferula luteola]